jgi:hypothetical protein
MREYFASFISGSSIIDIDVDRVKGQAMMMSADLESVLHNQT